MQTKVQSLLASLFLPLFAIGTIILVLTIYLPSQAANGTYTVNTTLDNIDGPCNAAHCSLREAILAANSTPQADTISFSLTPSATIVLNGTVLPYITGTLTIDGSTAENLTISGDNASRVFLIGPLPPGYLGPNETGEHSGTGAGTTVTITHLTISDGFGSWGGAIFNDGALFLQNSTVSNNYSLYGAVYNNRTLTVTSSAFISNTAGGRGGALVTNNFGTLTIVNSDFISNTADSLGGAFYLINGDATIKDSTFSNNWVPMTSGNEGGAIYNNTYLTVINSTFDQNSAYDGGAINSRSNLTVANTTFSGNEADLRGGGIINWFNSSVIVINSTFSENTAGLRGSGIYNFGSLNLSNTIIANSLDNEDCHNIGTIGVNTHNLIEDGTCSPLYSGDPLLGPLKDNGGSTWTYALLPGSPAVDSADSASCAASPVNNLDQRGKTRPADGDNNGLAVCDIGSYEVIPTIGLDKSGPALAAAGEFITYTLTAVNNLTATLTNVVLTDTVPANANYISGGTLVGSVVSWTLPSFSAGAAFTRSFVVTAAQTITNDDYRISAAGGYSATGNVPVVTIVVEAISGLTAGNDGPTTIGSPTNLTAAIASGSDVTYSWAFGDGATGSGANPSHTYPDVGMYTAVVTASNPINTLTATTVVTIEPDEWTVYLPVVVKPAVAAGQPPLMPTHNNLTTANQSQAAVIPRPPDIMSVTRAENVVITGEQPAAGQTIESNGRLAIII